MEEERRGGESREVSDQTRGKKGLNARRSLREWTGWREDRGGIGLKEWRCGWETRMYMDVGGMNTVHIYKE